MLYLPPYPRRPMTKFISANAQHPGGSHEPAHGAEHAALRAPLSKTTLMAPIAPKGTRFVVATELSLGLGSKTNAESIGLCLSNGTVPGALYGARKGVHLLCYDRRAHMAPRKVYILYVHVVYGIN